MAIENINEIEQSLGIESGQLTEMISSEENHKVDLSGLVIKSTADHEALINNIKKEAGVAAVEIAIKNARKDLGLSFEGKTMENLLKAHRGHVEEEAKIEPNKKYDMLKGDFETLQKKNAEWEEKYTNLEASVKKESQRRKVNSALTSEIPTDQVELSVQDLMAIANSRYEFGFEDGEFRVSQGGQVMKNPDNLNPLTAKEFMKDFLKPYYKKVEGGRGGNKPGDPAPGTLEAFEREMDAKGVSREEFNEILKERIEKGTLKIE